MVMEPEVVLQDCDYNDNWNDCVMSIRDRHDHLTFVVERGDQHVHILLNQSSVERLRDYLTTWLSTKAQRREAVKGVPDAT